MPCFTIALVAAMAFSISNEPGATTPITKLTHAMGLSAESLAASGVRPPEVAAIVAALRSSDLDDQLSQLYVQIRAAEAARAAEDAEPEAAQMLADAPTLEQLRAQRTAIITAARQLARQQLGAAEAAALGNWWAAPPFLPAEMRVRSWTTAEVGPVYGALAAERRCAQRGEAMPADSLVLLANLRAEGAVVTASSNLLINAAAARNALNSARSNPN